MKKIEDIETVEDILDAEREMIALAEKEYGNAFHNAAGFNTLLNNFLKEVKPSAWVFLLFLSQIKKHLLLALFSVARFHKVQAMLNLRQVLEAGVNAAYGLENPEAQDFVVKQANGTLKTSDALDAKRRKWIEKNYKKHSDYIKIRKTSVNEDCAHSNMIYAFNNFSMKNYTFHTPFFDQREEHLIKADFWLIGDITLSLLDLFFTINKKVNQLTFIDDFSRELETLKKEHDILRAESEKDPHFQPFIKKEF